MTGGAEEQAPTITRTNAKPMFCKNLEQPEVAARQINATFTIKSDVDRAFLHGRRVGFLMIVRRFLAWSRMVPASQRAEGVRALALGYLYSPMADELREEAEAALTGMLEDPSPIVRLALAEAFASAVEAPHHCVIALAHDQPEIAAVVLGRSPLLRDEDLIDCASRDETAIQCAIAARPSLSAAVSAVLAETGSVEVLTALARNGGADIPDYSLRRMVERAGDCGAFREAMLERPRIPADVRSDLVHAGAAAMTAFVTEAGWLSAERAERLHREITERADIAIAIEALEDDPSESCLELTRRLRTERRLTPALMLRALLCEDRSLFEAALAELSGQPLSRVRGFVRDHQGGGFSALYGRASLPADLLPVFRAALAAQDRIGVEEPCREARLSRRLIAEVLRDCSSLKGEGVTRVNALLRRLDAEAAQQNAKAFTERLIEELHAPLVPRLAGAGKHSAMLALTAGA